MKSSLGRAGIVPLFLLLSLVARVGSAEAAPEGTMTWGVHVSLAARWLDPNDTEAFISPFLVLYAIHDALVKPMPGGDNTPCLAESWTVSKDGLSYEFVLRKGAKFHHGEPVTAEDVQFLAPNRIRFVLKEPWPDFMTFYGTSATGAAWIVPKKYVEKVGDDGFK